MPATAFNLFVLRRLFNKDNKGNGVKGKENRTYIHTSLTPLSFSTLASLVPLGAGGYGAPVIEIAIRLLLCLVGSLGVESVTEIICLGLTDRGLASSRLRQLADSVDAYHKS